jgi:hypothetical protein
LRRSIKRVLMFTPKRANFSAPSTTRSPKTVNCPFLLDHLSIDQLGVGLKHGLTRSARLARAWKHIEAMIHRAQGRQIAGVRGQAGVRGHVSHSNIFLAGGGLRWGSFVTPTYQLLTSRQMNGRLVRNTLSCSQELELLKAASAWEEVVYHLTHPVKTLREEVLDEHRRYQPRSPAMATGLTNHIWSIKELLMTVVAPKPSTRDG